MKAVRRAFERGVSDLGWLRSAHTFSFGDYYDPGAVGFRALRVINDDRVEPRMGFGTHPHRDMEIVSFVVAGALAHKDSTGTASVIAAGDVQRMSAGTGVMHSEFNASSTERVRFLQIWIVPKQKGLPPGYEQRNFPPDARRNRLCLMASDDGRDGSVTIHQDVALYAALLDDGAEVEHRFAEGRHGWLQVVRGAALLDGNTIREGDGVAMSDEKELHLTADGEAEVLLFDLA